MNDETVTQRANFEPPPPRGLGWSIVFALLAHALLIAALAWGIHWKKEAQDQAVEAELWSATPQTAAPPQPDVPPPPPQPETPPVDQPPPHPTQQVDDDTAQREAELALEQKKREDAERKKAELERRRQEAEAKAKAAQEAAQAQARADAAAKKAADKASAAKAAALKASEQKAAQQKAQADAKADAARREDQMRRLNTLASADEVDTTTTAGQGKSNGNAHRDAGPSRGYGAKIRTKVRPNIAYPNVDQIRGNPKTVVEVWVAPDGTITNAKITQPSGVPLWDKAVLGAVTKTHTLPRDIDGRVFSPMLIEFTPSD